MSGRRRSAVTQGESNIVMGAAPDSPARLSAHLTATYPHAPMCRSGRMQLPRAPATRGTDHCSERDERASEAWAILHGHPLGPEFAQQLLQLGVVQLDLGTNSVGALASWRLCGPDSTEPTRVTGWTAMATAPAGETRGGLVMSALSPIRRSGEQRVRDPARAFGAPSLETRNSRTSGQRR